MKKRRSDLAVASFEAELNWQEQLIFTLGRLTELKQNNKDTSVGFFPFFCLPLPFVIWVEGPLLEKFLLSKPVTNGWIFYLTNK